MNTNEHFSESGGRGGVGGGAVSEETSDIKYSKLSHPSFVAMRVYGLFICVYLSSGIERPAAATFVLKLGVLWRCLG